MNNEVNYVITALPWDASFDECQSSHPNVEFLQPMWVFRCGQLNMLIDTQPYALSSH